MLPLGRLPTVQVLGMAEKDEEKNLFVIRGTVWGVSRPLRISADTDFE